MTGQEPAQEIEAVLTRIERVLHGQLERIAAGDWDGLTGQFQECQGLLGQLPPTGVDAARHAERIERIQRLHGRVGLALAQQREELSRRLRQGRQGRAGLGAYRRALS